MLIKYLRAVRASLIRDALDAEGGNITQAATRLGVQRNTLKYMIGADTLDENQARWYADLRRDAKEARLITAARRVRGKTEIGEKIEIEQIKKETHAREN